MSKQRADQKGDAIRLKRAYEKADADDGFRVLVDRLWPRGVSKRAAHIDLWCKEIAPSSALRTWFHHDPERWQEFRRKYSAELKKCSGPVDHLRALAAEGPITLVYGAKDTEHTHAIVLKDFIERTGRPRKRAAAAKKR